MHKALFKKIFSEIFARYLEYMKQILENWNRFLNETTLTENMCPIRGSAYGGIPSSGNFKGHKEYTVAAQRYFEAAHCILGSLGRRIGAEGETEWHSMARGEKEHLLEEIRIMLSVVNEYSKELYVQQINDLDIYKEKWKPVVAQTHEDMVSDIREKGSELISLAQENAGNLDLVKSKEPEFPDSVYDVGMLTYRAIETVASNLIDSVRDWEKSKKIKQKDNAWAQPSTRQITSQLNSAIQQMLQELG